MRKLGNAVIALELIIGLAAAADGHAQEIGSPEGIKSERALPSRYPHVVQDALKYCQPKKGFWIDLGAGKGQVAIPLIEATDNPVVMLDPNAKAISQGMQAAREKGLEDRLSAVVGVAEDMPFPDNSVDLVVSRGSVFFWDDAQKGLQEVYRVLRPGGKAYVGGGAGSGYPDWAVKKLIEQRKKKMEGDEAEKWNRFVELRRPEQMRKWAENAKLPEFKVMGRGAISAEDERVGQGVWLLFEKQPDAVTKKPEDRVTLETAEGKRIYKFHSPSGIGAATINRQLGWPDQMELRLYLKGLESLTISNNTVTWKVSVASHGGHPRRLSVVARGKESPVEEDGPLWTKIEAYDDKGNRMDGPPSAGGYFEMNVPKPLIDDGVRSISVSWIDFFRG